MKQIFTSYYLPKMIVNKIEQHKIAKVLDLVYNTCNIKCLDDNFLKPEVLQYICDTFNLSPSIFYDAYYSFIFSGYPSKILQWRQQNKKISQKKAAKLLKVSPVDLGNWERQISYPSRYQFEKLQEVIDEQICACIKEHS